MKAFISYSHQDSQMLEGLHKHLAQLQRDRVITTWSDNDILAGGDLDQKISISLASSQLFLALLSPDYLASNYCYEKEFQKALEMNEQGDIIIVPIIVEPCDWHNTPFKTFKALPRDGKAISTWENRNTAFLDVIQNIRKLLSAQAISSGSKAVASQTSASSRNYRVQKDFDSIDKLEFTEKTFNEVKEYLKRFVEEITELENIKSRVLVDSDKEFRCLLVNRNKIATEAQLSVLIDAEKNNQGFFRMAEKEIWYSITQNNRPSNKSFVMAFDEYHLFWSEHNFYSGTKPKKDLGAKEIADIIWNESLESIGIM